MKISVVTISFNQAGYLRQCIDSVLNQDYADVEYIVVDPGSTDGSREIIESYGDRIISVFGKDGGPADGLNKGFLWATGDIYYFINSDDFVFPGALTKCATIFANNSQVDIVLAGGSEVNTEGITVRNFYPSRVSPEAYVNGAVTLFQQGMFFRSKLFKLVGGFNVNNKTSWDGELLLQFSINNARMVRVMEKVAAFRIYPESITGSQRFATQYKLDRKRMYEQVYGENKSASLIRECFYRFLKLLGDPLYIYKRLFG